MAGAAFAGEWWIGDDRFRRRRNVRPDGATGRFQAVIDGRGIHWPDHLDRVTRTQDHVAPQ